MSRDEAWTAGVLGLFAFALVAGGLGVRPDQAPEVMVDKAQGGIVSVWDGTKDFLGQWRPSYVATDRREAVDAALKDLRVAPETEGGDYDRGTFGQPWADTDRNGCDTRNDILARDLTGETKRGRCVVLTGILTDPYTGEGVRFEKATAGDIEIDHVVSLAGAWRSGASTWTADKRRRFANDPSNLLAVQREVNRAKSDDTAADWRPPGGADQGCGYARIVVRVKVEYGLTATEAERKALAGMLGRCATESR